MAQSVKRLKRIALSLFVAFVVLTPSIVLLAYFVPELKTASLYSIHGPISVEGNDALLEQEDLVTGTGTSDDPFVIEGIGIIPSSSPGIQINDTDSYIVIRNCHFEALSPSYSSPKEDSPTGILLANASHVRVESSSFDRMGAGIRIQGEPASYSGDVIISRCVFFACWNGIVSSNATDVAVEYCSLRITYACPIVLDRCYDSVVVYNYLGGFGGAFGYSAIPPHPSGGVAISNSSAITVSLNFAWGEGSSYHHEAVEVYDSEEITIVGNTLNRAGRFVVKVVRSAWTSVVANSFTYDSRVYFSESTDCTISRNSFGAGDHSGSVIGSFLSNTVVSQNEIRNGSGIHLESLQDCSIEENLLTNCDSHDSGLGLWASGKNVSVSRNVLLSGYYGISVQGEHIDVENNIVSGIYGGYEGSLGASSCYQLKITNNSISNATSLYSYGALYLTGSTDVLLTRNNISGGLWIQDVQQLVARDNVFSGPAPLRIYEFLAPMSEDNIVHNSFMDCPVDMWSDSTIVWNDSYPAGGNYWSLYAGDDAFSGPDQDVPGADGIGDEPYVVEATNIDSYPLMEPVVLADGCPPITHALVSGTEGYRGWYRSDLNVSLSSWDNHAGTSSTIFRLDGGAWQGYENRIPVSGEGYHLLEYYSEDNAGNGEEVRALVLQIDSEAPVADDFETEYTLKETVSAIIPAGFSDELSGLSRITAGSSDISFMNTLISPPKYQVELEDGLSEIYIFATDMAGNEGHVIVYLDASINYNREPLSLDGPYGPFLVIALLIDLAILVLLFSHASRLRYGEFKYRQQRFREPGEREKESDVEDGYPKWMRKV